MRATRSGSHLFNALFFLEYHGFMVLADRKRVQFRMFECWEGSCHNGGCIIVFALFSARKNASSISQPGHQTHTLVNEQRHCAAAAATSSIA